MSATLNWWRGAAIYQVYPRSFADSNGDGVGDLPGITQHLEHIAALNVDGIWLSPFFTSPMRDFGYDISDYRNVDPMFGTLADFDHLLARAHELGLRVIIDQVYSHTSDEHPWFKDSRSHRKSSKADWYVWADAKADGSPPNNWQSVFGGPAWQWDARRCQYYLHNFLIEQPDLNVHNPQVQAELLSCAKFWLDRGVDGFRLDAINYAMHDPLLRDNPVAPDNGKPRTRPCDFQHPVHNKSHDGIPGFVEQIRKLVDSYGDRFTVAEVGGSDAETEMQLYTRGGQRLHSAYGFNFLYADQLTPALVRESLLSWPQNADAGWPSWAFSNHDAPRAISRWAGAPDRAAMARMTMLLLACLRGNVFLYQGEELGLPQAALKFEELRDPEAIANWPLTLGRDGARTPLPWTFASSPGVQPWLPVVAEHRALSVESQQHDAHSQLAFTRRLFALRRHHEALRTGSNTFHDAAANLLVFERRAQGQSLWCVFNLGAQPTRWQPPPGQWRVIEASADCHDWTLPPRSGLIAEAL